MTDSEQYSKKVEPGLIWIAAVLLLGILFYAGLLITLVGVFTGIQKLIVPQKPK